MEVTNEMIEAVRLHQAAEQRRKEEEWRQERIRKQSEAERRLRAGALAQARTVLPDLTEEQFGILEDVYNKFLHDLYEW